MLKVESRTLTWPAFHPAGGPHKREEIPQGSTVYLIRAPRHKRYFYAGYLDKAQAETVAKRLIDPANTRAGSPLDATDIAANYRREVPSWIARKA